MHTLRCAARLLLAVTLLSGCASDPVYMEGRHLIETGRTEDGLALLEKAARDNPRQQEMRFEWLRQRELAAGRLVSQAETARANGQLDDAAAAFGRALRLDPDHPRAKAGYAGIAGDRRHAALVWEAEDLNGKRDFKGAETRLRAVLSENPLHHAARNLMRRVTDAQAGQSIAAPTLRGATGKRVTLEFREANLRSVFEVVARTTGLNFVFDKDVRPDLKTTIVVRNSSVDDVIRLILVTSQLERKVLNDNTLLIYPNTPAKLKEYQELVVRSFYMANADVKMAANMVRSIVKTRDLYVDEKLNLLVMKDTPDAVRLAEKLIAAQDLVEPEVTLEVEVMEVGATRMQELGVRFPDRVLFQDPASVAAGAASTLMRASGDLVGFVATPALALNLRQQDGKTNVLANPRIRVKNREKARVHIGDRVPVVTTTSTANVGISSSVSYLDVGLKLEVEPTIHLDGDVAIKVGLEVSNIVREVSTAGGGLAYQLGTRNAATVLRLRDGETQILAGLISDDERTTANKLPGLGDLPLLGRLFSSNLDNRAKTEIVLLITPRIVRSINRPEHMVAEFYSGTEAAVGVQPLAIGATPPGTLAVSAAPGVAGPVPAPGKPTAAPNPANLLLAIPAQADAGKEFTARVSLPVHPSAASAQFDLVYDAGLLAADEGNGGGRAAVRLLRSDSSPAVAEIRFRVMAKTPVTTQLRIENLDVRDAAGNTLPANQPTPQTLSIVQ